MRAWILAVTLVAATAAPAGAGVFGGFSADESTYLRGTDAVCTPIEAAPQTNKMAACRKAAADEVARLGFRKTTSESGPTARFAATASGATLTLSDARSAAVVTRWTSLDPISEVVGVHVSRTARLVAVELRVRSAGRLIDEVLVVRLPVAAAPAPAGPAPAGPAPPAPAPAAGGAARSKAMQATLNAAWKQSKVRLHAKAEKSFRDALVIDAADPEARYGLAVSLAGQKKKVEAIAELQALAASTHAEAIIWRVEARLDPVFKPLLADPQFRKAVGLDGGPGKSVYERLVGVGGKWEQPAVPCDAPGANLELHRRPREFDLVLKSRCQGMTDTTRLDGTWTIDGAGQLVMTLPNPNPGDPDETVPCSLAPCGGEECMTCGAGTDFEMHLRSVQR